MTFNGHLYAGTFNHASGFQLWKTRAEGSAAVRLAEGHRSRGGTRKPESGRPSMSASTVAVYRHVHSGRRLRSRARCRPRRRPKSFGSIPTIPGTSSSATPRITPAGIQATHERIRARLRQSVQRLLWRMCVHGGRLYVGTFSWSVFLPYVDIRRWPEELRAMMLRGDIDAIATQPQRLRDLEHGRWRYLDTT